MKRESIRYTLSLVVLAFCILGLACPAPQDEAVNNANNVAEKPADDAADSAAALGTCDSGDLQTRIQKVRTHLNNKLGGMIQTGVFEVKVDPEGENNIAVSFLGKIWGLDGSNTANIKKLSDALKGLAKSKCVTKVTFGPIPTPTPPPAGGTSSETLAAPGFEWTLCEDPQIPCPDGTCRNVCAKLDASPTPTTEANSDK